MRFSKLCKGPALLIFRDLRLRTTDVTVLRTRVGHSWLGHCILHVSCEQAVAWLKKDDWPELHSVFPEYENDARELARRLGDLNAAVLVDELPALKALPESSRKALARQLRDESRAAWDPELIRTEYNRALGPLLEAAGSFRSRACAGEFRDDPSSAISAWSHVRDCAETFRKVLQQVPAGVVLP